MSESRVNVLPPKVAKTNPFVILFCLMPDDFTCQGRACTLLILIVKGEILLVKGEPDDFTYLGEKGVKEQLGEERLFF